MYLNKTFKVYKSSIYKKQNQNLRCIDINPPLIFGQTNIFNWSLKKNKIISDNYKHKGNLIKKCMYGKITNELYVLDIIDKKIRIFDKNCNYKLGIGSQFSQFFIEDFHYEDSIQRVFF